MNSFDSVLRAWAKIHGARLAPHIVAFEYFISRVRKGIPRSSLRRLCRQWKRPYSYVSRGQFIIPVAPGLGWDGSTQPSLVFYDDNEIPF